jgi:hypothetical protein
VICFAKSGLTEELYIVHKEEFSIICYTCYTYTWRKAKRIHKRWPHPLVREDVAARVQLNKKIWSWSSRGLAARRTDWRWTTSRKVSVSLSLSVFEKLIWASSIFSYELKTVAGSCKYDNKKLASMKQGSHTNWIICNYSFKVCAVKLTVPEKLTQRLASPCEQGSS